MSLTSKALLTECNIYDDKLINKVLDPHNAGTARLTEIRLPKRNFQNRWYDSIQTIKKAFTEHINE